MSPLQRSVQKLNNFWFLVAPGNPPIRQRSQTECVLNTVRRSDLFMRSKIHTTLISALSVVFLFAGMAFAKTKRIDVIYDATVGKTLKLKPGNYRIDIVNNTKSPAVNFYNRNGKLVGQVPVKVVSKSGKNSQTQIDYNTVASNHVITEISPSGWKENLYFPQSQASKMGAKK
jgi:hypothetical protein